MESIIEKRAPRRRRRPASRGASGGPYLSERQWGTVREDYSDDGAAWDYFTHDQARSRAYRWGEDGIAGVSDDKQRLCFALALWNGADPILKERLFGLTNSEGNHGEDVKEYYFYLDSTPTHSWMRYLYKYPQRAYPYADLVETNRERSRHEPEYELLDTGVFDDDRYFDVFVDYAKGDPDDLLIQITVCNRGPEDAPLHVLPTLWFRNTWWQEAAAPRPLLLRRRRACTAPPWSRRRTPSSASSSCCAPARPSSGSPRTRATTSACSARPNASALREGRLPPPPGARRGRRAEPGAHRHQGGRALPRSSCPRAASASCGCACGRGRPRARRRSAPTFETVRRGTARGGGRVLRLDHAAERRRGRDGASSARRSPACCGPSSTTTSTSTVWLEGARHPPAASSASTGARATREWFHMLNDDVISMPDKWEYPWYAAWDLAFHAIALSTVDLDFAKQQLGLMLSELYLHPSGQLPAYEWNFGDVNPPVHAFAAWFVYRNEKDVHRQRRRRLARAGVPEAAGQLHLVGQPQGSERQERLRGRLPRARQHRRVRPQRAAADRRLARAGRRHGVDGVLQPDDAADRARAGRTTTRPTSRWRSSSSSTRSGSPRRWIASATTTTRCGTTRTASSTTCCACRTAARRA